MSFNSSMQSNYPGKPTEKKQPVHADCLQLNPNNMSNDKKKKLASFVFARVCEDVKKLL